MTNFERVVERVYPIDQSVWTMLAFDSLENFKDMGIGGFGNQSMSRRLGRPNIFRMNLCTAHDARVPS
jgi:hypothetical protein